MWAQREAGVFYALCFRGSVLYNYLQEYYAFDALGFAQGLCFACVYNYAKV